MLVQGGVVLLVTVVHATSFLRRAVLHGVSLVETVEAALQAFHHVKPLAGLQLLKNFTFPEGNAGGMLATTRETWFETNKIDALPLRRFPSWNFRCR